MSAKSTQLIQPTGGYPPIVKIPRPSGSGSLLKQRKNKKSGPEVEAKSTNPKKNSKVVDIGNILNLK